MFKVHNFIYTTNFLTKSHRSSHCKSTTQRLSNQNPAAANWLRGLSSNRNSFFNAAIKLNLPSKPWFPSSTPARLFSEQPGAVSITSKFGTLVPTPKIPGLYVYEDFLTPEEHDSFVRGLKESKIKSVPVEDPRIGKFLRYIEPFENAWNIMEKIGDSGLLGEELEIAPDGEEDTDSKEEQEILAQVSEIQKQAGGAKVGVASMDAQGIKALRKQPIDPEEGEDDPIYLNDLKDENGKPLVADEDDPASFEGLPTMGNSFYIQEYPRDGFLAPSFYVPGGGETEVIVSFYSPVVMEFRHNTTDEAHEVLIKPRSVYILKDEALRDWSKSFSADPIHTHKGKPIPRGIRYVMKFCASVNPSALKEDIEGEEEGEEEEEEEQEEQQKSTPLSPKTKQTK